MDTNFFLVEIIEIGNISDLYGWDLKALFIETSLEITHFY